MKKLITSLFIVLLVLITGCQQSQHIKLSENSKMAKKYLENQGYEIISYEEYHESYKLTKHKLESLPYKAWWSMPGNDPKPYYGKTVHVQKFIVKNHPLDHWECCNGIRSKGKVNVYVYLIEGEVVGGISYPDIPEDSGLLGGYWSLDGRTD
jgi:hypothetical protein